MKSVLVDGEFLSVALPESFEEFPHDELEEFMRFEYANMWGVREKSLNLQICVTWKDSNKVLTKLVSEKSFAKQVDDTFAKRYRKDGYRSNGFFERVVAGADHMAQGLRFAYASEGVPHEGLVLVFKRGIRCYTLCCYMRADTACDSRPALESVLESLEVR